MMAGAYLLFTLVITALAASSAGLAFGLSAPELRLPTVPFALVGGGVTAALVLFEMLTRDGLPKTANRRYSRASASILATSRQVELARFPDPLFGPVVVERKVGTSHLRVDPHYQAQGTCNQ